MFANQLLADDIIQQVIIYLTLKRPVLIHVYCSADRVEDIWNEVVLRWNQTNAASINSVDDFDRYRIQVRFLGMPFKSHHAQHHTFTVGKADVVILETK